MALFIKMDENLRQRGPLILNILIYHCIIIMLLISFRMKPSPCNQIYYPLFLLEYV